MPYFPEILAYIEKILYFCTAKVLSNENIRNQTSNR